MVLMDIPSESTFPFNCDIPFKERCWFPGNFPSLVMKFQCFNHDIFTSRSFTSDSIPQMQVPKPSLMTLTEKMGPADLQQSEEEALMAHMPNYYIQPDPKQLELSEDIQNWCPNISPLGVVMFLAFFLHGRSHGTKSLSLRQARCSFGE